jgi:signal transduction histidine kinase
MDTLNILVVDDEPGMVSGIERVLRDWTVVLPDIHAEVCFSVTTAGSGEEALDMIRASAPDILLLDHKLPGLSGLDVLEQISTWKTNTLTIMITAYASLETAVTAIKCGAYDFLAKPFTPGELKATVRKAAQSLVHARQARSLAKERQQVRFQFISVLAHELKAPLAAIEGYLDIIRNRTAGDDPGMYDSMLDQCNVRLDGMRKMIMDLLDLTRIESGQKKRDLIEVDINTIAQKSMETIAAQALARNITLSLQADKPVLMYADQNEMEIILNNLISNAVKYNRDNGRVDIAISEQPDGRIKISVTDTGIGISREDAARLFNDFVRIKNSSTRNILGSGLGLSIVKKIAYLYNGHVTVESEPGQGSCFTVFFCR